jgi:hypothetical protein
MTKAGSARRMAGGPYRTWKSIEVIGIGELDGWRRLREFGTQPLHESQRITDSRNPVPEPGSLCLLVKAPVLGHQDTDRVGTNSGKQPMADPVIRPYGRSAQELLPILGNWRRIRKRQVFLEQHLSKAPTRLLAIPTDIGSHIGVDEKLVARLLDTLEKPARWLRHLLYLLRSRRFEWNQNIGVDQELHSTPIHLGARKHTSPTLKVVLTS